MDNIIIKWVGKLISGLTLAMSGFVGQVMLALGVTMVTINYLLPQIKAVFSNLVGGLHPSARELIGAMGFDVLIVLVVSAYVARYGSRVLLMATDKLGNLINNAGG